MDTLAETYRWFELAKPNPTDKQIHTQLGVHFEEVGEMIDEMKSVDDDTFELITEASGALLSLSDHLKHGTALVNIPDKAMLLDALCDQIVTVVGVARDYGLDIIGALGAVNEANYSKFVDGKPIFDENMKVKKGPNYRKADLTSFVSKA